jgi:hypothetical protein
MNETKANNILRTLLRAGKAAPKLDTAKAELPFDTRLMATIRERQAGQESLWVWCNRFVWRLVPVMTAIVLLLACLEYFGPTQDASVFAWSDPLGFELALSEHLGGGL